MVQIGITRASSRGQIVLPVDLREGIVEGDKLIVIRNGNQIILKKAEDFESNIEEDLEFAQRTDKALQNIEEGRGVDMDFDEFIDEVKTW
ncbi:MAG: AbrB family looped-hinge helix DNA binding protein [Patescibacteria group bacterium]|jgi:AbrB family looped-hinge helix DNA binding protein